MGIKTQKIRGKKHQKLGKNPENPEKNWGVCVIIIGREGLRDATNLFLASV